MTTTIAPYRSGQRPGHTGFARLLWAEWTKFWTVRGWVASGAAAVLTAALATVALAAASDGKANPAAHPGVPIGPGGTAVTDSYYFMHRPLSQNGSITVKVTSLADTESPGQPSGFGPAPWAKAGILIAASTKPGAAYAAIMATPGHGVRMQYDYGHDIAGLPGAVSAASPRWLRLTRAGDTITGYDSADGTHWAKVGTARLAGLPATVQAGLFAASPPDIAPFGQSGAEVYTQVRAVMSGIALTGGWPRGSWHSGQVGTLPALPSCRPQRAGFKCRIQPGSRVFGSATTSAGTVTLTGSGDIAPYVPPVDPLGDALKGTLLGLVAVIALGAVFVTSEYRRGLIRTTFAASPRRGRVLVAKAIVIAAVGFAAGLAGAAFALPVAAHRLTANGWLSSVYPVVSLTSGTGLRVVAGTAALIAAAGVLALAAGAVFRRSTGAIATVVVLFIVPIMLTTVVSVTDGQWLMRLTPAAAFGLQQAVPRYPQVISACAPHAGCYPLAPWTGFAVLCGYAVAALGAAVYLVRRRDA